MGNTEITPRAMKGTIGLILVDNLQANSLTCPPDFQEQCYAISRNGETVPAYGWPAVIDVSKSLGRIESLWGEKDKFYFNYSGGGFDFTNASPGCAVTGRRQYPGSRPGSYPLAAILLFPKATSVTLLGANGAALANDTNLVLVQGNSIIHRYNPKSDSSGVIKYYIPDNLFAGTIQALYNAVYGGFPQVARVTINRNASTTYRLPAFSNAKVLRMGAALANANVRCIVRESSSASDWYGSETLSTNSQGNVQFCIPASMYEAYFLMPQTGTRSDTYRVGTTINSEIVDVVNGTPTLNNPSILSANSLRFSWEDLSNVPNHAGYYIELYQGNEVLLNGTLGDTSLPVSGFIGGQDYGIMVGAYDTKDRFYAISNSMTFTMPVLREEADTRALEGFAASLERNDNLAQNFKNVRASKADRVAVIKDFPALENFDRHQEVCDVTEEVKKLFER